jgi:hypothetical protein
MSDKPRKPGLEEPEAQYEQQDEELGECHEFSEAYWDAWFERNHKALNASIRKAEEQFARGEYYTMDQVWERMMAVIERVAKKP